MQDYEEKIKQLKYTKIAENFKLGDLKGFIVKEQQSSQPLTDTEVYDIPYFNGETGKTKGPPEFDVPVRRFIIVNEKIKQFPLKEKDGNIKLMDFNDGLGEVYAYRWKNDPEQGWISFWAQFENSENITIDKDSTVSSNCYLFAKNGKISITKTKLIGTQIWSNKNITFDKCDEIRDCYIFGSVNIIQTNIKERNRFFTDNCTLNKCNISGNNLFLQDEIDCSGSISLTKTTISGNCEIIGSVSDTSSTFSGKVKISGNVSIDTSTISDSAYINAGKTGNITIGPSTTISGNAVIINNAIIGASSSVTGSSLVGDNASLTSTNVSGTSIILDNANLSSCTVSGNSLINMQANASSTTFSGNAVMTGSTSASGTTISGNGILAGNGTSKSGGSISGSGKVFNGVSCTHGVSTRHWDNRSCKKEIDKLIDEREACICPTCSDCEKDMPTPDIC